MPDLYPEDQERVDKFLKRGVNSVERKPMRFFTLLIILLVILGFISVLSYFVGAYFDML